MTNPLNPNSRAIPDGDASKVRGADDVPPSQAVLLTEATNDVRLALRCMEERDWLRADILLKLAVDTLADTGLIP